MLSKIWLDSTRLYRTHKPMLLSSSRSITALGIQVERLLSAVCLSSRATRIDV